MAPSRTAVSCAMLILVSLCSSSSASRVKVQSVAETSKNSNSQVQVKGGKEYIAGFEVKARYKCIFATCTDFWCDANCNHVPKYCPASFCKMIEKTEPQPPPVEESINHPGEPDNMCVEASTVNSASTEEKDTPKYFCCAKECGTCGGVGCSRRGPSQGPGRWFVPKEERKSKGGSVSNDEVRAARAMAVDNCCVKEIKEAAKSCNGPDGNLPPCVIYNE